MVAALVALKSTFLPAAVLFGTAVLLLAPADRAADARSSRPPPREAGPSPSSIPWMVSLKLSSGTFFFPFLGAGNQNVDWD